MILQRNGFQMATRIIMLGVQEINICSEPTELVLFAQAFHHTHDH
jgi:hypothetical protein